MRPTTPFAISWRQLRAALPPVVKIFNTFSAALAQHIARLLARQERCSFILNKQSAHWEYEIGP
jgi:hypothetical protein